MKILHTYGMITSRYDASRNRGVKVESARKEPQYAFLMGNASKERAVYSKRTAFLAQKVSLPLIFDEN